MRLGENIAFYVYTIFVIAYATTYFDYSRGTIVTAVAFASVCQFLGMLGGGWWSDRVGRKIAMLVPVSVSSSGLRSSSLWCTPRAWSRSAWVSVSVRCCTACSPDPRPELFPTERRFAGSSLVVQGSSIIAGAPAPVIAVWLVDRFGTTAVVLYLVLTMVIAVIAVATSRETKGVDLDDLDDLY